MNVEDDFTIYTAHRRNILCDSYSMTHTYDLNKGSAVRVTRILRHQE